MEKINIDMDEINKNIKNIKVEPVKVNIPKVPKIKPVEMKPVEVDPVKVEMPNVPNMKQFNENVEESMNKWKEDTAKFMDDFKEKNKKLNQELNNNLNHQKQLLDALFKELREGMLELNQVQQENDDKEKTL